MMATLVTTPGLWPVSESIHCPLDTDIQYALAVFIGSISDSQLMNTSGDVTILLPVSANMSEQLTFE